MPSNREWLNDLAANDPQELNVWFEAEHVDETNGIRDEITSPEGDVVAILRKAATCTSVNTSVGDVLRYNVPGDSASAWQTEEDACEALADMVERDYVRREMYDSERKSLLDKLVAADDAFIELKSRHCPHYHADKHYCDVHETRIKALTAERDEWKEKAEGFTEALEKLGCSVLANGTVFDIEDGGLRSNDGVTNIEWYAKNDLRKLRDLGIDGNMSCNDCPNQCVETEEGTPPEECQRRLLEWLMAPHVDAQRDSNGTCPDAMGQSSTHSKAQSKDAPTLSDLYGILSDDNSDNLGKSQDSEIDSREKLRKDIIDYTMDAYNGCWLIDVDTIDEWLDRQAEITAKEVDKLTDERDFFAQRVDELNTQVQEQSELIAARGKTIEALEKFMSERKYKLKKQLESKNEQCRKLKAERDEYRELYEAAMSTDYGQLSKECESYRSEIGEMLDAAQQIEMIRAKYEE